MAVSLFKVMQYNDLCNISDQSLTTTTHRHPEPIHPSGSG